MKKAGLIVVALFIVFIAISTQVQAIQEKDILTSETGGELVEMKSKFEQELEHYEQLYGSKSYGLTAFILNKVRVYSIPLCFIGIAVGSIYQYVIGIRRLDIRDKGFALIMTFVTILVICQVLPLIFAIIVNAWRG